VVTELDVRLSARRTLHVYDTGSGDAQPGLPVIWLHGTLCTGEPPAPLFAAAAARDLRWVSYDRPGYGGSPAQPGRDVAAAAADVAGIADALGFARFAVFGYSGGAPHALACAALVADRVLATVSMAGLAPFRADGLDWFAGMAPSGTALLRAAAAGPAALDGYLAAGEPSPDGLTRADYAALAGDWSWLAEVAGKAIAAGPGGMPDDELAVVAPWGFGLAAVHQPVLLVHGGHDRIAPSAHSEWLARECRAAQLWLRPDDGHISVLGGAVAALDWIASHALLPGG
jgi:pimeloyl-ACP methyl ester carboxylesterase